MARITLIKKIRQFLDRARVYRVVVLYGGAGAGKSWTLARWLILRLLHEPRKHLLVTRKTNPALRLTNYRLILDILNELNIPYQHKRADQEVILPSGSVIFFRGLDDPEKIKSAEFNYIWMEEATEFTELDYQQLRLRLRRHGGAISTRNQMFLTFNPVDINSWIYKHFFEQPNDDDTIVLRVTYRDNPFLDDEYVQLLESLREQDHTLWKIYGLGEFAQPENIIYTNYTVVDSVPDHFDEIIYGLDFGYNNPTACVKIGLRDQQVWILDELYETRLTHTDLMERLEHFIEPRTAPIYCDPSEPNRIEELYRAGFNAHPANRKITVKAGIDFVKRQKIFVHSKCVNTLKELSTYKWREDKNGNILDEPVKFMDHLMDATRYALTSHCYNRSESDVVVI